MKFIAAPALLLATTASAFPSFSFLRNHRALVSQQCMDETDTVVQDSMMMAAVDAIKDEIGDKAGCSDVLADQSSCQVDFGTFDSTEEFMQVCEVMGGKAVSLDLSMDCKYATAQIGRAEGGAVATLKGFNFKYSNLMDCVSFTCDDESVVDKIGGVIANTATNVSKTTGATCTHSISNFSSTSADGTVTKVPIIIETVEGGVTTESDGEVSPENFVMDSTSSAQCRSLMTAVIGAAPIMAFAL